jgi:hypothetical protein
MASQLDLDQGGTTRQTHKVYLGPSVGWVEVSWEWVLNVTTGGTTTMLLGTNLVLVNFNGAVTIQLPSFKATSAGAQAIPRQFLILPVVISDVGGFAFSNNITILPFGSETLSGLASIKLSSNYGSIVIRPDIVNGGGTLLQ